MQTKMRRAGERANDRLTLFQEEHYALVAAGAQASAPMID